MPNKNTMKMIDKRTGFLECKVCGQRATMINPPDGKRVHGLLRCPNGCTEG
jgi:hypothetical protein